MASTKNIDRYVSSHSDSLKNITTGINFYGESVVDDLCRQAIEKGKLIEFYYADDQALQADKLSFRFYSE